jgi:hypothetical protein
MRVVSTAGQRSCLPSCSEEENNEVSLVGCLNVSTYEQLQSISDWDKYRTGGWECRRGGESVAWDDMICVGWMSCRQACGWASRHCGALFSGD